MLGPAMGDHDSLFKRAFELPAHAAGEIRSLLPEALTGRVDLTALELVPASFVDAELGHRHADLLFTAPFEDARVYVYFLFEHQSEPDPLMPWRILVYQQRIWAAVLRAEPERRSLPPIVTIIVHHGQSGWTAPRSFHAIIDRLGELPDARAMIPNFELLVDDLATLDDEALQRRPLSPFPKVALWVLRDARNVDAFFAHLQAWAAQLQEMASDASGLEDVEVVVRYISRVVGTVPADMFRRQVIEVAPAWEDAMATIEEQWIAKGFEKGIERGIEQGIEKGIEQGRLQALEPARKALVHLLTARFGQVQPDFRERIARGTASDIDAWIERAAVAEGVDDVFR